MKKKLILIMRSRYGCHYGDLFTSKSYVKQIVDELKNIIEIQYCHNCHFKALADLELIHFTDNLNSEHYLSAYIEDNDTLYINIWSAQRAEFNPKVGCNHDFLQRAWKKIYEKINKFFNVQLELKCVENYIPTIDYSFFDNLKLKEYIKISSDKKKILISNGPVNSGQSFSNDMSYEITELAKKYEKIDFICSCKFNTHINNIRFTDDIISQQESINSESFQRTKCDLNEISFLSTFCDIIVGKNSGPFIYCLTKENLFDSSKSIISFHKKDTDDMLLDIAYKCDYKYYRMSGKNYNPQAIFEILDQKIIEKIYNNENNKNISEI